MKLKRSGEMGIYNLLKDMYMETDESFDLGDFEQDFLGNRLVGTIKLNLEISFLFLTFVSLNKLNQ